MLSGCGRDQAQRCRGVLGAPARSPMSLWSESRLATRSHGKKESLSRATCSWSAIPSRRSTASGGADVASYMDAREAIEGQFPGNMLRVTSNFRSRANILNHVNLCFRERLRKQAPGYVALESTL